VQVPTTTKQPTVSNAEVDRMMKEFAEPAMSGTVTVQTDAAHTVRFSPQNSLWKFLKVKAVDGKLVDSYDEAALKELYGGTFNGVQITRATGQKTDVTVQDVIGALRQALKSKTERVAVIETDPS
jgi:G:T/U-mismatch repair DNA glycosylase